MELIFVASMCLIPLGYMGAVIGFIRWYHKIQYSTYSSFIWIPLLGMVFFIPIMGCLTVLSFGGAFGPGAWINIGAVPFTLVALIYFFFGLSRSKGKSKSGSVRYRWIKHSIALICIVSMGLSPIIGFATITNVCSEINQGHAQSLIDAINAYETDNGDYPEMLYVLMPDYVQKIPSPICFNPAYGQPQYFYEECSVSEHIVWYDPPQSGFPQRYYLETGVWISISFFDGVCSYLNYD